MRRFTVTELFLDIIILQCLFILGNSRNTLRSSRSGRTSRRHRERSADLVSVRSPDEASANSFTNGIPQGVAGTELEENALTNSLDFVWSTQTVAAGDTAVLHCSFDAIFSQLRNGNINWMRETSSKTDDKPTLVATGRQVVISDRRYRVYRPHNSALSVLIIRRAKKRDAGIYRCNLAGSSTRQKYMVLNVTDSKIEAQTSPAKLKTRVGRDVTLWCNATGYPKPIVYWTREDRNRKLPDGSYQHWGSGLSLLQPTESDTGIYACYLDNFVQPVVSYKFSLMVEDRPWNIDAYKMRFDSSQWFPYSNIGPKPITGKSYLLMCETKGNPRPVPQIKWYRDGKPLKNSRHFYIIEDKPEWRSSYTSSTLVIMRFVPRHQGNYTCVASNAFRTRRRDFQIQGYILKDTVKSAEDLDVDMDYTDPDPGIGMNGRVITEDDYADPIEESKPRRQKKPGNSNGVHIVYKPIKPGKTPGFPLDKPRGPTDDEDFENGSGSGMGDGSDGDDEGGEDDPADGIVEKKELPGITQKTNSIDLSTKSPQTTTTRKTQ